MTAITEAALREMLADAEKATPGPWCYENCGDKCNDWVVGIAVDETGVQISGQLPQDDPDALVETVIRSEVVGVDLANEEDARHIANMDPATAARLIRCALAARVLVETLEDNGYCDWCDTHLTDATGDATHSVGCAIGALARELEGR